MSVLRILPTGMCFCRLCIVFVSSHLSSATGLFVHHLKNV